MKHDLIYNDFTLMVATVNGSGSQSANTILLKTLFRMGIGVSGKNVFPSNIAGLPTWFWIRASHKGYAARRAQPSIVVAMNSQTLKEDMALVEAGGYFLYNSDLRWPEGVEQRSDIINIPVPIKSLVDQATDQIKIKKLLANIIYVGVLADLLELDLEILASVMKDQFAGKTAVLDSNTKAMQLGLDYAKEHLAKVVIHLKAKTVTDGNKGKMILDGNTASGLGLIYGGATFASWYPITPSSSLVEAFGRYISKVRPQAENKPYAIIQAEDELSAVCMAIGAGWQGARAFTATSGPGLSLMQEAVGFAYFTEIPVVIWDVQRVGPSTGMPTRTAQGDILSAVFASHGDTKHPVLLPGNMEECFSFGQEALDIAERLQSPTFVLTDLDLGMNLWTAQEFKYPTKPFDRGKVLTAEQLDKLSTYERYGDPDGDGVGYRALPGTRSSKAPYLTRGSGHNKTGAYTEKADEYQFIVDRLAKKWELAKTLVPKPVRSGKGQYGVIFYGSAAPAVVEAQELLANKGLGFEALRIRALPFGDEVKNFIQDHKKIFVVDLNRDGQMYQLLKMGFSPDYHKFISIRHYEGTPITAEAVFDPIFEKQSGSGSLSKDEVTV